MRARAPAAALLLGLALPGAALARPNYFDVFAAKYGFAEGDRLYTCGNCHLKWEGTGGRNPFGATVEQQVYLGKPISQAIDDAVTEDPDGDGFTSVEELAVWETLPGYNCTNFVDAIGPPPDWHTFVTPGVASCLEPHDVRLDPEQLTLRADAGRTAAAALTVFNNGSEEPLEIYAYGFLPGADPSLSVSGPPAPLVLGVGESAALEVTFAPAGATLASATLRVESDDPDEPAVDAAVTAIGRVRPLASAEKRAACLRDVSRSARAYAKAALREWARCYEAEGRGYACRRGERDRKLQGAEEKLRASIGGESDRHCEGADLSPSLVGQPETCGGGCGAILLDDFGDLAECLVCRAGEGSDAMLEAGMGTSPPDLPANVVAREAARCQSRVLAALRSGILEVDSELERCELANVTSEAPVDCRAALESELGAIAARVDARLARCKSTSGLEGCFAGGDPTCLGSAAVAIGRDLVEAAFGLEE